MLNCSVLHLGVGEIDDTDLVGEQVFIIHIMLVLLPWPCYWGLILPQVSCHPGSKQEFGAQFTASAVILPQMSYLCEVLLCYIWIHIEDCWTASYPVTNVNWFLIPNFTSLSFTYLSSLFNKSIIYHRHSRSNKLHCKAVRQHREGNFRPGGRLGGHKVFAEHQYCCDLQAPMTNGNLLSYRVVKKFNAPLAIS